MAPKPSKSKKKSGSSTRTADKKKAPAASQRTIKRAGSGKTTTVRGQAAKRQTRKSSLGNIINRLNPFQRMASRKAAPKPVLTGISLDRKLDILGIVTTLVGVLTLLSLLSSSNSAPTGSWLAILRNLFGWGSYLFPLGLIGFGVWLVLRNFERIPQLSLERFLGALLLYANLLTLLHFILFPAGRPEAFALVEEGRGGGYFGALFLSFLQGALGLTGTLIACGAWLLIGLALALDASVMDLFRWIPPLVIRLQDWWDDRRSRKDEGPGLPAYQSSTLPGTEAQSRADSGTPEIRAVSAGHHFYPAMHSQAQAWVLPKIGDILEEGGEVAYDDDLDRQRARIVEETLASFGAPVNVVEINRGPTITQFGVEPDFIESRNSRMRVRVGKIAALADDLALALSARRIRVEAPVPGKGYVGIEVPNENISIVALKDVIESEAFRRLKSPLRFAIGQDVAGNAVAADLVGMPHLLIAGQTGSGKSVCVNTLIACLLLYNTPDDLRMVMVDPKRVELTGYNGIPHLLAPVVVETERVVGALQWVLREMDQRYHKLAELGTRNIGEFNARMLEQGQKKLPYLLVIIDELADLMMLAPDETERTITRLAQLARATGIHLVIATQRPSTDVVTGLIKANFPARIAFAVASGVDSRVILDQSGAERLLGRGDMLFLPPDAPAPLRLQGGFVSDAEIQSLVDYWRSFSDYSAASQTAAGGVVGAAPSNLPLKQMPLWEELGAKEEGDPLLNEAVDLVRRQGRASISMLQRRLRIGYTRSARLIETMQSKGIIGTDSVGSQGFEVLDYGGAALPLEEQGD
jgi:DNA segregation ATPase FtsK/SpoIIIE, S-DNA-T family